MVYAGFWRRTAAFLVDLAVILLFAGLAAVLTISLSNAVPQHPEGLVENLIGGAIILLLLISANACIAMILVYFPLLEGRFGRTLGKRLFGLRVRSEDGLPASYWQAFLRRLSFYFEIFPIEALFLALQPEASALVRCAGQDGRGAGKIVQTPPPTPPHYGEGRERAIVIPAWC